MTLPNNADHITIKFCVKGEAYQKLYIVDPREERRADSLRQEGEGEVVGVIPFWNAVRSGPCETTLVCEMITATVGFTETVKND